MYCGHARLCVCLSVRGRVPTLLHGPSCNWGSGRECPLVVHYWEDLQLALCDFDMRRLRRTLTYLLTNCVAMAAYRESKLQVRTRNVSECSVLALCVVFVGCIRVEAARPEGPRRVGVLGEGQQAPCPPGQGSTVSSPVEFGAKPRPKLT